MGLNYNYTLEEMMRESAKNKSANEFLTEAAVMEKSGVEALMEFKKKYPHADFKIMNEETDMDSDRLILTVVARNIEGEDNEPEHYVIDIVKNIREKKGDVRFYETRAPYTLH